VGVKDIYDTADFPTENGSVLDSGRRPRRDAWVVSRLRAEGAVVLGKTVTTEYACFAPGPTRNPRDPERTPGGSSSGSAAALAAGVVPLALGSQTNGSVIRPASFCGVHGYKPTFGLVPRTGCLTTSRTLDHPGFFARSLDDVALVTEALTGHDDADPATASHAILRRCAGLSPSPSRCRRARLRARPTWEQAEPGTREAFAELADALAVASTTSSCPGFADAVAVHRVDLDGRTRVPPALPLGARRRPAEPPADGADRGRAWGLGCRLSGRAGPPRRVRGRPRVLLEEYDAIVTPAAPGEAPLGLEATGSPAFCSLWTLAGLPALSLPILQGPAGLPLGCQLVAGWGDDARLFRLGRWLETVATTEAAR
jgi:Asp-tRNA(Asn)/Glu-tRNA(Gln) amidotransferase A subunit family amidase